MVPQVLITMGFPLLFFYFLILGPNRKTFPSPMSYQTLLDLVLVFQMVGDRNNSTIINLKSHLLLDVFESQQATSELCRYSSQRQGHATPARDTYWRCLQASLRSFLSRHSLLTRLAPARRCSYSDSRTHASSTHPLWWSNKVKTAIYSETCLAWVLVFISIGEFNLMLHLLWLAA